MGDVLHRKKGGFEFASTDVGPRYHIAAVVNGLLCGRVGKIVARMEKNCKWLWAMSSAGRTLGVAWCELSVPPTPAETAE